MNRKRQNSSRRSYADDRSLRSNDTRNIPDDMSVSLAAGKNNIFHRDHRWDDNKSHYHDPSVFGNPS